jgi:magnesium-protoporphyrin IX monomethyl ester (oxidative) cyclase
MEDLRLASDGIEEAKRAGGLGGRLSRIKYVAAAGMAFARMYFMKPQANELPRQIRLAPAW